MSALENGEGQKKALGNWRQTIDECIAKAIGNSFRQQILWILNERVLSPSEIAKELGESLNKVCHHINVLKKARCIELAFEQTTGNTVQHFYKATSRAFLEDADWLNVPKSVKVGLRATLLQNVIEDAVETVAEGIYDAYEGSHMSWTPMILDDQGRKELTQILERALQEVIAVQESAKERLGSSDAMGVSHTVSILGYPSVGGEKKVGPPTDAKELATSTESAKTKAKVTTKKAKGMGKGRADRATAKSKRKDGGR